MSFEEKDRAYGIGFYDGMKQGRKNGIDELANAIVQKFTEYDKKGYTDHTNVGIKMKVLEIAEQIKEQTNEKK